MTSPFPGMDPYLEQHWHDVHHRLITYTSDQLRPALPRELRSRIEERVFIESDEGKHYPIFPDVHVVEYPRKQSGGSQPADDAAVAVAEPILVHVDREPASQGYIEIVDAGSGNRVVTVIEFLSPTNKLPGEGQTLYLKKQKDVIAAGASLVEIDLTRAGKRSLAGPVEMLHAVQRTTYMACITRGWKPGVAELYPLRLTEPLPALRIPLRQTDADVTLNLQSLIDQCYENGGYDTIDYRKPPVPPLDSEAAVWAEEWLRAKGMLTS
jgi:hypothetical protein